MPPKLPDNLSDNNNNKPCNPCKPNNPCKSNNPCKPNTPCKSNTQELNTDNYNKLKTPTELTKLNNTFNSTKLNNLRCLELKLASKINSKLHPLWVNTTETKWMRKIVMKPCITNKWFKIKKWWKDLDKMMESNIENSNQIYFDNS